MRGRCQFCGQPSDEPVCESCIERIETEGPEMIRGMQEFASVIKSRYEQKNKKKQTAPQRPPEEVAAEIALLEGWYALEGDRGE